MDKGFDRGNPEHEVLAENLMQADALKPFRTEVASVHLQLQQRVQRGLLRALDQGVADE